MTTVLFDLFGTLVPSFSRAAHDRVLADAAVAAGVPVEVLHDHWTSSYRQRVLGATGDFIAQLAEAASMAAVSLAGEVAEVCATQYRSFVARSLTASPGTLSCLERLRTQGCRFVLVSNANRDVARGWPASNLAPLFDHAVFSCEVGVAKPDAAIYEHALDVAGARGDHVWFVGDGGDDELAGAEAVDIRAVLLRCDLSDAYDADRPALGAWSGPVIDELHELVELLSASTSG